MTKNVLRVTSGPALRRAVVIALIAAAHIAVLQYLLVLGVGHPHSQDVVVALPIYLQPKPPPAARTAPTTRAAPVALPKFTIPNSTAITLPPPNALRGLYDAFGCTDADAAKLSPEERSRCANLLSGTSKLPDDTARLALSPDPAEKDKMTPAERTLREMRTANPCLASQQTHEPDCIYSIIYGNKLP